MKRHLDITVKGKVQNVYFRKRAKEMTEKHGLDGFVLNDTSSTDTIYLQVEGEESKLKQFADWCKKGPYLADVKDIEVKHSSVEGMTGFEIKH